MLDSSNVSIIRYYLHEQKIRALLCFIPLLSSIGYGFILHRICKTAKASWPMLAVWGISIWVFLGGILNLVSGISRAANFLILAIGLIFYGAFLRNSFKKKEFKEFKSLNWLKSERFYYYLLAVTMSFLVLFFWATPRYFNMHDDFHAYFAFPKQMLEAGTLMGQSLNERAVFALGGFHYLQSLFLTLVPHQALLTMDPGFGLVLAMLLVFQSVKGKKEGPWILFPLFFLFMAVPARANSTAAYLALAFFFALYLMLEIESAWVPIGLTVAALISFKTTFIPAAVMVGVFYYLLELLQKEKMESIKVLLKIGSVVLICISPWLLAQKITFGTFLFPFLGKGFHASGYSDYPTRYWVPNFPEYIQYYREMLDIPQLVLLASPGIFYAVSKEKWATRNLYLSFFLASLIFVGLMDWYVGNTAYRYAWPLFIAMQAIALKEIGVFFQGRFKKRSQMQGLWESFAYVGLYALIKFPNPYIDNEKWRVWLYREATWGDRRSFWTSDSEAVLVSKAQGAVPEKEKIVAHVDSSYLLNFARNPVLIVDIPGTISPPPYLPLYQGPKKVKEYLLGQGIRYVMYSYRYKLNFPAFKQERAQSIYPPVKIDAQNLFVFQDVLDAYLKTEKIIYKDDLTVVFDLARN